jgi:hypothetical protein
MVSIDINKTFKANFSRYGSKIPDNMRSMLSGVLSFADSFDMFEEVNFSILTLSKILKERRAVKCC